MHSTSKLRLNQSIDDKLNFGIAVCLRFHLSNFHEFKAIANQRYRQGTRIVVELTSSTLHTTINAVAHTSIIHTSCIIHRYKQFMLSYIAPSVDIEPSKSKWGRHINIDNTKLSFSHYL